MGRIRLSMLALLALGACGGSPYASHNSVSAQAARASAIAETEKPAVPSQQDVDVLQRAPQQSTNVGPIAEACLSSGRQSATAQRCGCVQSVANRTLSEDAQIRGAILFEDPDAVQHLRRSNAASDERFWEAWQVYGERAAKLCA